MSGLLDGLHPDRIGAALGLPLADAILDRLIATRRLAPRLLGLIARQEALAPWPDDPVSDQVMRLDQVAFLSTARAVGAAWHARSLRSIIMTRPRALLLDVLGEPIYAFAVAHAELAAEDGVTLDAGALLTSIETNGMHSLSAWGDTLEPAAAAWFRLKFPIGLDGPDARHRAQGPAIVACVRDQFLVAEGRA
jgi:hypothetical protein